MDMNSTMHKQSSSSSTMRRSYVYAIQLEAVSRYYHNVENRKARGSTEILQWLLKNLAKLNGIFSWRERAKLEQRLEVAKSLNRCSEASVWFAMSSHGRLVLSDLEVLCLA